VRTLLILLLLSTLNAGVNITQNMKALYKGVELSERQKEYILYSDANINMFEKVLENEIEQFETLNEKNVVSFLVLPSGEITNFKFLKTSYNKILDKITKDTIKKASSLILKPKEKTEIRYIISFRVGDMPANKNYSNKFTIFNKFKSTSESKGF